MHADRNHFPISEVQAAVNRAHANGAERPAKDSPQMAIERAATNGEPVYQNPYLALPAPKKKPAKRTKEEIQTLLSTPPPWSAEIKEAVAAEFRRIGWPPPDMRVYEGPAMKHVLRKLVPEPKALKGIKKQCIEAFGMQCFYCEKLLTRDDLTFDHQIPLSKDGPHAFTNIVPSCGDCNREKSAQMPTQTELELAYMLRRKYRDRAPTA